MIDTQVIECRKNIISSSKVKPQSGSWLLNWFVEHGLRIEQVQFGSTGTLSNVGGSAVIDDLRQFDLAQHYIDKVSNLYFGNINARLPEPDDKLSFCLSSLPARVEDTVSPESLVNIDTFAPTALIYDFRPLTKVSKPKQLPEAVRVTGSMRIVTNNKKDNELELHSSSIANVAGALDNP